MIVPRVVISVPTSFDDVMVAAVISALTNSDEVSNPDTLEWSIPVERFAMVTVPEFAMTSRSDAPVWRRTDPEVLASESPVMMASETLASDPAEPGIEEVEIEVPSEKKMAPPEPEAIRISPPTVSLEAVGVVAIPTVPEKVGEVLNTTEPVPVSSEMVDES